MQIYCRVALQNHKKLYIYHFTKSEAATLLVKAFKLPKIEPMIVNDPNIKKSVRYQDPLGVIDESFTIPSAKDIINHWGYNYIEGLLKVRADEVIGDQYLPNEAITKSKWITMIVNLVYGVEQKVNVAEKAAELGIAMRKEHNSRSYPSTPMIMVNILSS